MQLGGVTRNDAIITCGNILIVVLEWSTDRKECISAGKLQIRILHGTQCYYV